MANTTNLKLPFLMAAQAQKHVSVNEALLTLDTLVQANVIDRDLTAPPVNPSDGDRYIVGSSSTGAWVGKDFDIAVWQDGIWKFLDPGAGWTVWVQDEASQYIFNGTDWAMSISMQPASIAQNHIINGGFDIDQRASGPYTSAGFTLDRWYLNLSGATASVAQGSFTVGQTDVPGEPEHYLAMDVTVGNANVGMQHKMEDVRALAGRDIVVAGWLWSDTAKDYRVGVMQDFGSGGSSFVNVTNQEITLAASTWTYFEFTVSMPSISGKTIGAGSFTRIFISDTSVTVAELRIANIGVWLGTTAPLFERPNFADEFARCQRFYQILSDASGVWDATTSVFVSSAFCVEMRAVPTVSLLDTSPRFRSKTTNRSGTTLAYSLANTNGLSFQITGFSGATAGEGAVYFDTNSDLLGLAAEL